MNVDVLNRSRRPDDPAAPQSRLAIADCDIHPRTNGYKSLYPWLSQRWQEHVRSVRRDLPPAVGEGAGLPEGRSRTACRRDAWPPGGGQPGSDLAFMAAQYLDPSNVTLGILNPLTSGPGRRTATCRRRVTTRDQRVAGRRMDCPGCAAEGLGGGAV